MAIIVIVTVNQSPIDHLCTSLSLHWKNDIFLLICLGKGLGYKSIDVVCKNHVPSRGKPSSEYDVFLRVLGSQCTACVRTSR